MKTRNSALIILLILLNLSYGVAETSESANPKIKAKEGTALYKQASGVSFVEVTAGQELALNDELKTMEKSTVDVEFDLVNLFRVQAKSHIKVNEIPSAAQTGKNAERLYNLGLIDGSMIAKLNKLPQGTRFEVQTPVAVAGARGTAFAVTEADSRSTITTLENKVDIKSKEERFKSVVADSYRRVVVSPWDATRLSAVGTGVLSEAILGRMIKDSMDKIMLRAEGKGGPHPEIPDQVAAKAQSEKEARAVAENKLAEIISEIKIGPEKNLANLMFDDTSIAGKLFEMVSKARTIETKQNPDGSVTVVIELRADEIQQLVKQRINVWKSIKIISRTEYMQAFPALARVTTERAAKLDGYRRLAEKIYGTVVSSETTVEDLALKNDTIKNVVQGVVQGATVTDTVYYSDGSIKVTMAIDGSPVRNQISSASGEDLGNDYVSSPEGIEYNEYRFFEILKEMK